MRTEDSVLDELELELASIQAAAPKQASKSKLRTILLVVLVTLLNAFGNLLLAKGMKGLPAVGINPIDYVTAMINPYVASGILLLILWLLTRMTLLSWADLSFSLPLMAIGYVIAPILGHFVLHEQVNTAQWIGTGLIFAGCGLVGTTTHKHDGAQA